jgi:hypothetical protein
VLLGLSPARFVDYQLHRPRTGEEFCPTNPTMSTSALSSWSSTKFSRSRSGFGKGSPGSEDGVRSFPMNGKHLI